QRPEILGEAAGGIPQMLARDVDWHISRRPMERLQKDPHLGAGAAAELDQAAMRTDPRCDLGRVLFKDRDLGAGRIVLGEAANRFEQRRAASVVEEFARDRLGSAAETFEHGVAKALLTGRQIIKRKARAAD